MYQMLPSSFSLMPTSPASRAVTDWDVTAVSIKQVCFLINHSSSNTVHPTQFIQHSSSNTPPHWHLDWATNSLRRLLSLPGAHLVSKGIFQPATLWPSVIIAKWVSSAQALTAQLAGRPSSSRGTGFVQPGVQLLPASLLFKAMHGLSDKVKCAKTLQVPPAALIFIVSP